MEKVYIGDAGTEIVLDVGSDITDNIELAILCLKPDGSEHKWIASLESKSKLKYISSEMDFDQKGRFKLQAYVDLGTWSGRGSTIELMVEEKYW